MIKKHFLLLALCVMAFLPADAITHRALIFGLGKYKDKSWNVIHGDNDIQYVRQLLTKCGFTDIRSLKNEQATKQGMVNAFRELTKRCQRGDVVYIQYSGHGQLMTDIDGDEALRTTSRYGQWDQSWVPYDGYMNYCAADDGSKHFCDDEVEYFLMAIRKKIGKRGKLVVVIDACHSGDSTFGGEEEAVRGVDIKFNMPKKPGIAPAQKRKEEQWLTISACKPYQLSMEMKDINIGKLTFALYSLGKQLFSLSNAELQKKLENMINLYKGKLPQTPVVSGRK